jgi:hypothetical protein
MKEKNHRTWPNEQPPKQHDLETNKHEEAERVVQLIRKVHMWRADAF